MEFKISVLGSTGAGKSTLVIQYVQGIFVERYDPTIEDLYQKQIEHKEKKLVLKVLDEAPSSRVPYVMDKQDETYAQANGILLVFSITSRQTFFETENWRNRMIEKREKLGLRDHCTFILVGTKSDMETKRNVSKQEAEELAKKWNIPYMEVSSKNERECIADLRDDGRIDGLSSIKQEEERMATTQIDV
eukprot:TRINITY_DN2745_c0_g1_i6.p1 TRINITY_DN2745_c0_g1~~TRINITY_DN2745_c0_g1_i6.p1  ORF type:complete len:190 (-),score=42.51 TRINITY_DN2745_c0_g1_i6:82-651(-)